MDARTGGLTSTGARHARLAQWLALAVPGALLLGAMGSQHLGGLNPCEMCMWQRWPHLAAVVLSGLSFTVPSARRTLVLLAALAIAVSGGIGVFHAGVEQGWWEGITTCSTVARGGSTEELLKSILATPLVRCDQIPWSFLGLSLAAWNGLVSLLSAGAILWLSRTR